MNDGTIAYAAVVLAGGAARRLGGADKPALRVGGTTLLDRVLTACADARTTVVVGPRRPTGRPVVWVREEPAGSGPLAALAAGLGRTGQELVLLLAADLPHIGAREVRRLLGRLTALPAATEGVVLTDPSGHDQPLAAAYRTGPLRREAARLAAEHGTLTGLPLRLLTARLALDRVPDRSHASFDCDTWEDVTAARARLARGPGVTAADPDRGA